MEKLCISIRFRGFLTVKIHLVVFWVITPRNLIDGYKHIGEMYCLHL
jgi:hypothetical protein